MAFADVLQMYSIATIGDGLVSQIPALLVSVSTGMIVTRAVSEGSLNTDVTKQFLAQPQALIFLSGLLAALAVVPGMPHIQLALIAAMLIALEYNSSRNIKKNLLALEMAGADEAVSIAGRG